MFPPSGIYFRINESTVRVPTPNERNEVVGVEVPRVKGRIPPAGCARIPNSPGPTPNEKWGLSRFSWTVPIFHSAPGSYLRESASLVVFHPLFVIRLARRFSPASTAAITAIPGI